jgi:hypothetical protein
LREVGKASSDFHKVHKPASIAGPATNLPAEEGRIFFDPLILGTDMERYYG